MYSAASVIANPDTSFDISYNLWYNTGTGGHMSIFTAASKYAQEFHKAAMGEPNDYEGAYNRLNLEIVEQSNREYRRGFEAGRIEGKLETIDRHFERMVVNR
jgi:hypothetical protein